MSYWAALSVVVLHTLQVKWKRRRDWFNVVRENSGNSYLKIFHHRINSHRLSAVYVFVS